MSLNISRNQIKGKSIHYLVEHFTVYLSLAQLPPSYEIFPSPVSSNLLVQTEFYYFPSFRKFINNILSQLIMKLFRIKLSELNLMGRLGVKANYLFFSFKHRENIADIIRPKYLKLLN